MTWAKRLKRVFNIEAATCDECGADVRIIASIEDSVVIQKILVHLDNTASSAATALLPDCRASPSLPVRISVIFSLLSNLTDRVSTGYAGKQAEVKDSEYDCQ